MASAIGTVTKCSSQSAGTDTKQPGDVERPHPRSGAQSSPSTRARELIWLDDIRRGYSIKQIARREGLSCRRIQHGVSRARQGGNVPRMRDSSSGDQLDERHGKMAASTGRVNRDPPRPPRLIPLFPIGAFTPRSECPHHGPIRAGSAFCCMVCSHSGVDDHPALKRDPRTDPRPEHQASAPARVVDVRETRKQRRQRLNGARPAGPSMVTVPKGDAPRPPSRPSISNP